MAKKAKVFYAGMWVDGEIQAMEDSYGNTREQAIEFVRDLLEEGEYRDELDPSEVREALRYIKTLE